MRTPSVVILGAALVIGIFTLQTASRAQNSMSSADEPQSEASVNKQMDKADTQTQREIEGDKTTVFDRMGAVAEPKETTPTSPIEIETISGVPGDPKFEAQLTQMIDDMNRQATEDVTNDPTIQR